MAVRVVFMGSPEFALPSLRALRDRANVVAVVTQPDKPAGRGRRPLAPPVAAYAREHGLHLLQPRMLKTPSTVGAFRALSPDLLVTVAYGRIIPLEILTIPPLGAINAHPSLLPAYRGSSPIQRAIQDGQSETGVTIMYQTEELDAGPILLQERVSIHPQESAGELEERLTEVAARLLVKAVEQIMSKAVSSRPQDHAEATYTRKLTKEEGLIDWTRPVTSIVNQVRAMAPWPSAFTYREGNLLKIWRVRSTERAVGSGDQGEPQTVEPGTVLAVEQDGIVVAAGEGTVQVLEVQPESGRRMDAAAFARGHRVRPGERWGRT